MASPALSTSRSGAESGGGALGEEGLSVIRHQGSWVPPPLLCAGMQRCHSFACRLTHYHAVSQAASCHDTLMMVCCCTVN